MKKTELVLMNTGHGPRRIYKDDRGREVVKINGETRLVYEVCYYPETRHVPINRKKGDKED